MKKIQYKNGMFKIKGGWLSSAILLNFDELQGTWNIFL